MQKKTEQKAFLSNNHKRQNMLKFQGVLVTQDPQMQICGWRLESQVWHSGKVWHPSHSEWANSYFQDFTKWNLSKIDF